MITMQSAFTEEIDSPEDAAREIVSQLDLSALGKNSVAIITAYWEIADTGVLDAISAALPFDCVGSSVMGGGVRGSSGLEQVSVTVLTSDVCRFETALSQPVEKGREDEITAACYDDLRACANCNPALVFTFCPSASGIPGNIFVDTLDRASGGVPFFGIMSNEDGVSYTNSFVFSNGFAYRDRLALLAVCGDITPRFYTMELPDTDVQKPGAIITKSNGNYLEEINDIPARDYFRQLGLIDSNASTVATLPLFLDYKDGTKPSGVALYVEGDDSGFLCKGKVPVGTEIAIASIDYALVMKTAEESVRSVLRECGESTLIFVVSCLSRCLMITPNSEDEMRLVSGILGDRPHVFMYAGGEICPALSPEGSYKNRYHNLTFTVMSIG